MEPKVRSLFDLETSAKRPWDMVVVVHGFPSRFAALQFEWAWQHPKRSRRLNQVPPKKSRERMFEYNIRLLSEMLNTGPWNRDRNMMTEILLNLSFSAS